MPTRTRCAGRRHLPTAGRRACRRCFGDPLPAASRRVSFCLTSSGTDPGMPGTSARSSSELGAVLALAVGDHARGLGDGEADVAELFEGGAVEAVAIAGVRGRDGHHRLARLRLLLGSFTRPLSSGLRRATSRAPASCLGLRSHVARGSDSQDRSTVRPRIPPAAPPPRLVSSPSCRRLVVNLWASWSLRPWPAVSTLAGSVLVGSLRLGWQRAP